MKATTVVLASFIASTVGMAAALDMLELASILASIAMSVSVVAGGVYIYATREWPLKVAITPLFIGCVAYLVFAYRGDSIDATDFAIELLDSIGIMFIIMYCIWNKRRKNVRIRQAQKETHPQEKDHSTQKMRIVR